MTVDNKMEGFIVGGVDIEIQQFPWLAQIAIQDVFYCGGVVISDRVILTAAHCVILDDELVEPRSLRIYLGSTHSLKGSLYRACAVEAHEKYKKDPQYFYFYDIGLMLLKTMISFSSKIQKAEIIPRGKNFKEDYFTMSVAGWGLTDNYGTSARKLKMTRMVYVPHKRCNNSRTSDGAPMPVPRHMFCLVAESWSSDCHGDSGSGVMWGNYLIGIVSTGRDINCGSETMPSMYTDVSYFRDWIQKHAVALGKRTEGGCLSRPNKYKSKVYIDNDFEGKRQHNEVIHESGNGNDYWFGLTFMPRKFK